MRPTARLVAISIVGVLGACIADLNGVSGSITSLIVLATVLVIAERFKLRPLGRAPLPLSFAIVIVLVRAADPVDFAITVAISYAVAMLFVEPTQRLVTRLLTYVERVAEALVALAAFELVTDLADGADTQAVVLGGLAAAAIAQIVIADAVTYVEVRTVAPLRARGADLALITSAILMAVGYGGIDGAGELGLWGPLLFSIPLVAAWYSFELAASTRRSFWQTIGALGSAPELAGLVRPGHAQRVADLAVAIGTDLGLAPTDIEQLETAALLHHLGAVCFDAPTAETKLDARAVSEAGGDMLRGSEVLAAAGDIIAAEPMLHRPPVDGDAARGSLAGQILKVSSAFDELTDGRDEHTTWALEAIYTGPLYVYDGRVVGALERALERRGVLPARV
jgi:hypothetical protein